MANDRPNFILILTDDQGWSGTSVCMDTKIMINFRIDMDPSYSAFSN